MVGTVSYECAKFTVSYTVYFHKLHSNKINVRNESLITFCRHTVNEFLHIMLLRYA